MDNKHKNKIHNDIKPERHHPHVVKVKNVLDDGKINEDNDIDTTIEPESATDCEKSGEHKNEEQLQIAMKAMEDRYVRSLAEKENEKKRAVREAEDRAKYAITDFAKDLTNCIDILFLSTATIDQNAIVEQAHFKSFCDGINMTRNEFIKTFEKHGLRRIDPIGEPFDHNLHQAVANVPDKAAAGTVVQVIKAGYILHGRILNPAMVTVSSGTVAKDVT